MSKGTIKFFNENKGFGFITVKGETSDVDVFVHASGFTDEVEEVFEGEKVKFDVVIGKKGPAAVNVKPL